MSVIFTISMISSIMDAFIFRNFLQICYEFQMISERSYQNKEVAFQVDIRCIFASSGSSGISLTVYDLPLFPQWMQYWRLSYSLVVDFPAPLGPRKP